MLQFVVNQLLYSLLNKLKMNKQISLEQELTEMEEIAHDFFHIVPGIANAKSVPVVKAEELSKDVFIKEWVNNNQPCLIKGAVSHWPASNKWGDIDYWKSTCDDFPLCAYPHHNYGRIKNRMGIDLGFYEAIDRLFSGLDHIFSMPSEPVAPNSRFEKLIADLPGFKFMPDSPLPRLYDRMRMFMYRRAATTWHYHDTDETLMCQIKGGKKVALFSPQISNPMHVAAFMQQELHMEGQSLNQNISLNPSIINVEEGDALYIPPYWHHGVVPLDGEIGFTLAYCWASPLHKFGDFTNSFVRKLYKEAIIPIKKVSFLMPVIAVCGVATFLFRKLKK